MYLKKMRYGSQRNYKHIDKLLLLTSQEASVKVFKFI